jgi:hypothetical protein
MGGDGTFGRRSPRCYFNVSIWRGGNTPLSGRLRARTQEFFGTLLRFPVAVINPNGNQDINDDTSAALQPWDE